MRTIMKSALFLALLFTNVSTFSAPDNLTATGYAIYSELSEDIFMTALYNESGTFDTASTQSTLEFKILSNRLSLRRFVKLLSRNASINNSPEVMARNKESFERFLGLLKDNLIRGDHLIFFSEGNAVRMTLDGIELGTVNSSELFNILLNTWVGNVPPSRSFKEALIGEVASDEIQSVFDSLSYDTARAREVNEWLKIDETKSAAPDTTAPAVSQNVEEAPAVPVETEAEKAAKAESERQARIADEAKRALELEKQKVRELQLQVKRDKYLLDLTRHARRNIIYPRRSQKFNQTGNVVAVVTINRQGEMVEFVYEEESEYGLLNKAVKKGVESSVPFPPIPEDLEGDSITFRVPVAFSLGG